MNLIDKKLANQYWKLAFHVEKAIYWEISLDSPTVPETKILSSNDSFYKETASNLNQLIYISREHEKKLLMGLEKDINNLISLGADRSIKNNVVKTYFKGNLERLIKERNSKSFCPACNSMYYPNGKNREVCRLRPGKEYRVYSCIDFDDSKCIDWEKHYSQIDHEIKVAKSALNELGEKHELGKPDFRIQKALEKYISRLK